MSKRDGQSKAAKATSLIAPDEVLIVAGPCSVESEEQFAKVAACVAGEGLTWIRGGAFKPRTNPRSFQGLGEAALPILGKVAGEYGLKVVTEVTDATQIEEVGAVADAFQIGTRNMTNFALLSAVGRASADMGKAVFFKRGMAATVEEWLNASEYILQEGAQSLILCERGIRTFEPSTRFTLDISAVPVVHKQSILPICVDVSHAAGQSDLVPSLAKAALAAGADAIMMEIHPDPPHALSDGPQQLNLEQFSRLVGDLRGIAAALGKKLV